jgi:hypothetical protein
MIDHLHEHARTYERLAFHYDITAVSFQRAVWPDAGTRPEPRVWSNTNWARRALEFDYHPDLIAHKLCADVLFNSWQRLEKLAETDPNYEFHSLHHMEPKKPFNSMEDLNKSLTCPFMESLISARENGQPARNEGWRMFEDRPGKPGWIIESGNSTSSITFVLPCGKKRYVGVEYLRSYDERMGKVDMIIQVGNTLPHILGALYRSQRDLQHLLDASVNRQLRLDGHWKNSASLSENHVEHISCESRPGSWNPIALTFRPIVANRGKSGSNSKFKILSVFSC